MCMNKDSHDRFTVLLSDSEILRDSMKRYDIMFTKIYMDNFINYYV